MNKQPWLITFTACWLAVVSFLYPIPHTIALRNLVLFVGCVVLVWQLKPKFSLPDSKPARATLSILTVLSLWLLAQTALFGLQPKISFSLLRGDWLISIVAMSLGALTVKSIKRSAKPDDAAGVLVMAVITAGMLHVIWLLGYQLWHAALGEAVWGRTPFAEKDYHSVIVNFLLALLLAEAISRCVWHRRFLLLTSPLLAAAITATGLASIASCGAWPAACASTAALPVNI